ncbi:HTH-type transcriptional activator CmpR [Marinomonas spartinae]|uniref:HTH-type transcriptional activator CmpR n=1 Tax=Marinomonas spartinae TaxID=1792290 RepID=A0A1A8T363_9GAMM|nr:LysR family transcriptional regulator [Marinomonas spartinae]SBS25806.1 HTH-type transcriptional activator CmpR [Marinomonas spartinae]SBS39767.1 HTH-type transcriptional activator CmpR [Marinomonas spartinae]
MKEINQKRLAYFYEAVALGTIRAAADKLDVAPSAVSRQIAQLEEELACILIERHRKGVRTTEAGKLLLHYYRESISNEEVCLSELQALRGLKSGHIALAIGEGFIGDIMSIALPQFQALYPDITLSLHIAGSNELIRRVQEDEAHIGVLFHPPHNQKLRSHEISSHPLCAIVPPSHPLVHLNRPIELEEILPYPIALQEAEFGVRQLIAVAEFKHRVRLSPSITVNSFSLLKEYVRSNMGITILPEFVVRRELEDGHVISLPIIDPILCSGEVHLVTRLGRQLTEAPLALLKHLQAWIRDFHL